MTIQEIGKHTNPDVIANLETALDRARSGEIHDIVIVGSSRFSDGSPSYFSHTDMEDVVRLLGYLEYAKLAVHLAIGEATVPND